MASNNKPFLLSIVIPIFNESEGLAHFHAVLDRELKGHGWSHQIIYVDDGSSDETPAILKKITKDNNRVKLLTLSRNFGKEQATTAGLHAATGDGIIIIDGDGQHPVDLIPKFVERWQKGAHVVVGVRTANQKEGAIKRWGSKLFYGSLRIFGVPNIVPGSTDFRLIDKQVLKEFNNLTERNRVTRALIDWLGYERDYIEFVANPRQHGTASYSVKKLIKLALNGFVSLSFMPLYLSGYMGIFITFLSFIAGLFAVIEKYLLNDPWHLALTGTAILGIMILFLVGILLIGQGLLAIYVARIYTEVQNRPLYVLKD